MNQNALVSLILICLFIRLTFEYNESGKVLSRKKRYLIFPDGSSLQLVYCLTIPALGRPIIFTIGWTAALAWQLPTEPYHPLKMAKEALKDKIDKPGKNGGWTVRKPTKTNQKYSSQYHSKKPTFAEWRDPFAIQTYNTVNYRNYSAVPYYGPVYKTINYGAPANGRIYDSSHLHRIYTDVYRRSRRDLYPKIEQFFSAQKKNGKECLMKAICEVSQRSKNGVGTFMDEIIKTIFKVKPHEDVGDVDHYDKAMNESHNCTERYSNCASSVWNLFP